MSGSEGSSAFSFPFARNPAIGLSPAIDDQKDAPGFRLDSPAFCRMRELLAPYPNLPSGACFATTPGNSDCNLRIATPPPDREFRGLWLATFENLDWPSRPGLDTSHQQAEMLAILDRAAFLHLNAVILQVRPACDALYDSKVEPWSRGGFPAKWGMRSQALLRSIVPHFAVTQAHQRGLELHAWFNPFPRPSARRQNSGRQGIRHGQPSRTRPHHRQLPNPRSGRSPFARMVARRHHGCPQALRH